MIPRALDGWVTVTSQDDPQPGGQLHPLLRRRFSPLAFDPEVVIDGGEVDLLLEAARWSPSAGNSQPWAFVTAVRGDREHALISPHLAASSARWAPFASLLVVNIAHRFVTDTDMEFSEFADYGLGQAVAHMTLQAEAPARVRRPLAELRHRGHDC